jgi:hypothetical protein
MVGSRVFYLLFFGNTCASRACFALRGSPVLPTRTHSNYDATNFASRASWLRTPHRDLLVFVLASLNVISISPTSTVFFPSAVSVLSTRQQAYKGNGVRSHTDSRKGQEPAAGIVPQWSILSILNLKRQHRLDFCCYMVFTVSALAKEQAK